MGDNIEDPFGNSDGEERELERPHTPDYHDGREEDEPDQEVFSEVSDERTHEQQGDERNKQSPVHPVADSSVSEAGDEASEEQCVEDAEEDKEVVEEKEKGDEELIESEENDLEENKDEEKGKEQGKDDETGEDKSIPDEKTLEEKESISPEEATLQETSEESADKTKKDVSKDVKEEEEEDLEMPLSPIGDLGLSEPEAAIVDDILKGDVSEMMPGEKTENKQKVDDDDDKNDNEEQSVKESEEEDQEAKHSPDEDEDDSIKEAKSEDQDIQDEDEEKSEPEEAGDQLIADIFGASDEEEEFEGFDQEDIELSKAKQEGSKRSSKAMISDDEDEGVTGEVEDMVVPKPKKDKSKEEGDSDDEGPRKQVWDFDVMMEQKKASRSRRRRKHDGDLINDNDDLVVEMIKQMQESAEEDRMLNEGKQAATKKLKFLPVVLKHLNKADLQFTFIDSGILNAIKDWLSPLPDGSLPHLQIRTGLLRMLSAFPALDTGALKMSGLGKAVMYLYRHPKEVRQNKDMAGKLINEWARPIFGVTSNFKSMSREEREERDYQNMSKRRRLSSTDEGSKTPRSIDRALHGEKKAARPGEKGFIMRARVPAPSNKDYVVRPKSNLDSMDFRRNAPKLLSRVDKQMRKFKDRNKAKDATLVSISIEGRKMAL